MEINLFDSNIRHIPSFNGYEKPKNITWCRDNKPRSVNVYTDHFIGQFNKHKGLRVAWLMEPSVINSRSYYNAYIHQEMYDYIISHDMQFLNKIHTEKRVWCPGSGSSLYKHEWKIYPKTKSILTVVGNKSKSEGHKLRHEIVRRFGDKIDVIGRGSKPFNANQRAEMYAPYRYQIAIHNTSNGDYWSDILIDCFLTGTIPILWKSSYIGKYFDEMGIIRFNNIDVLEEQIEYISDGFNSAEIHHNIYSAVEKNFETAKTMAVMEDYLYDNFFKQFNESSTDIS